MNRLRIAIGSAALVLSALAFVPVRAGAGPATTTTAPSSPEAVLRAKGLTRVGVTYLLDGDVRWQELLRDVRAAQRKLEAGEQGRAAIERELDAANQQLAAWGRYDMDGPKQFRPGEPHTAAAAEAIADANAARRKIDAAGPAIAQRRKDLAAIGVPVAQYLDALAKASASYDATARAYERLFGDEQVAAAINALNNAAPAGRGRFRLGPSAEFTQALTEVRKLRQAPAGAPVRLVLDAGLPHVAATFNGLGRASGVVDPGSPFVTLNFETAEMLGLSPDPVDDGVPVVTYDGKAYKAHLMKLRTVQVGPVTVENATCAVLPKAAKGADNVLGATFLRNVTYRLDLAAGELRLTQPPSKPVPQRPVVVAATQPATRPLAVATTQAAATTSPTTQASTRPATEPTTQLAATQPATQPATAQVADAVFQFDVSAALPWVRSDAQLTEGACYRIAATGAWTNEAGAECGPDGVCPAEWRTVLGPQPTMTDARRREWYVAKNPRSALVARVGTEGPTFFAGSEQAFLAPASGRLWFRMNDGEDDSPSRAGKVHVRVERIDPQWVNTDGSTTVRARIDATDFLHITTDGIYWEWGGAWGKVGEHNGHWPTVVNGILWWPTWADDHHTDRLKAAGFDGRLRVELEGVMARRGNVKVDAGNAPDEVVLRFSDNGMGSTEVGCALKLIKP